MTENYLVASAAAVAEDGDVGGEVSELEILSDTLVVPS